VVSSNGAGDALLMQSALIGCFHGEDLGAHRQSGRCESVAVGARVTFGFQSADLNAAT
jgi:hypothetical protein